MEHSYMCPLVLVEMSLLVFPKLVLSICELHVHQAQTLCPY